MVLETFPLFSTVTGSFKTAQTRSLTDCLVLVFLVCFVCLFFFQRGLTICLPFGLILLYTQVFLRIHPTDLDIEGLVSRNSGGGEMKYYSGSLFHCYISMHQAGRVMKVLLKLPLALASS